MKLQPKYFVLFSIRPWWIILLLILQLACDTTEPTDDLKPGRRDYTWTVDTIPVANSVMKDMWGSSPADIWICGDSDDRRQSLWHYDGTNFTPYNEYILSATSFCGFAQNNIWMSTSTGWLYHFNGSEWTKDTVLRMEGYNDVVIQQLCGTAPNNIYATGMANSLDDYRGVIARYDGKKWTYLKIPDIRVNFYNIKYDSELGAFFISGANFDNTGTPERLYTLKNNILKEIYAGSSGRYLGKIDNRVYIFGYDKKIYKYNGSALKLWIDLSNTNYLGRVSGKTEKDFFCNTSDYVNGLTGIGHWNGTDLATLYESKFATYRTLFFENEVIFFSGNYENDFINAIVKGKSNNK
ncbi:MAG: hypothetical protein WAV89_10535 [Ignavibacteriaceae bacterium]